MKAILFLLLLCCSLAPATAQVNYVRNPDFEKYDTCPYKAGQISICKYWQNAISPDFILGVEYDNTCAVGNLYTGCPMNGAFYQNPHSSNGMAAIGMYYDKTPPAPPPPAPFNNREYLQSHLIKPLQNGKTYCVSFWVNLTEASGYAHNKIGSYLDDGSINTAVDSAGKEITSVMPQVYTDSIIKDTMNWTKIEGSFVANGTETYLTIGNFFTNAATTTVVTNYWFTYPQYSYYLIDDVSVIPLDLPADAGADTWVEEGKTVLIGRVGDTTAIGLDCKWYHKGVLIDSGAIISVKANAIKYAVDTYVVVQTICGLVKTDTVLVKTVGLGVPVPGVAKAGYSIYPNPSSGIFTIASLRGTKQSETIKIYNLLAQVIYEGKLKDKETTIQVNAPHGSYIVELTDEHNNKWRERVVLE